MSSEPVSAIAPRMQRALDELQRMIQGRWPAATFSMTRGHDDPGIVHLNTTVDIDDTEAVIDLVIERMLELQIDENLPVVVIPTRPMARILAERQKAAATRASQLWPLPAR